MSDINRPRMRNMKKEERREIIEGLSTRLSCSCKLTYEDESLRSISVTSWK
jgi:hypothetical protein